MEMPITTVNEVQPVFKYFITVWLREACLCVHQRLGMNIFVYQFQSDFYLGSCCGRYIAGTHWHILRRYGTSQ